MDKISELRAEFEKKLTQIADLVDLDKLRVDYLGKKGSITALLKNMKALSNEEKKTFGAEVNKLKGYAAKRVDEKIEELRKAEVEREIAAMPQFDITAPANTARWRIIPRSSPTTSALRRSISPSTIRRATCRTPTT